MNFFMHAREGMKKYALTDRGVLHRDMKDGMLCCISLRGAGFSCC
jgi:hypothetical protein